MNNIQINYDGQRADINLSSIENVIQLVLQMGKDFIAWLLEMYKSTRSAGEPVLQAV